MLGLAVLLFLLGGPLALGLAGLLRKAEPVPAAAPQPWDWRLTLHSALLYALAFNLVFFIQELFLVVPKALTPGLRATLYHNNHHWEGDSPLASLFQGTGALAILLVGLVFALLVRKGAGRTPTSRLLLIWMAYNGLVQALPQVAAGAIAPDNDVGMAMDYFGLGPVARAAAAAVALAALAAAAIWLTRPLLALAGSEAEIGGAKARTRFIFRIATVPALIAIALILPFRVPREWAEVLIPPVAVAVAGIAWIQANAWRVADARPARLTGGRSLRDPLILLLIVLLFFQLVLRPGIRFY